MNNQAPSLEDDVSKPRGKGILRSVDNALRLLEAFTIDRPELGVTELSRMLGFGKSTVHRLLATLLVRGYVVKNPRTEKYFLGLRAFEVGSCAANQRTAREVAAPFLQHLMTASKETVHLGVFDGWEVVYIDKIESQQTLQINSRVGLRAPIHCTALGKALLAFRPEEELVRFLRRRLRRYTARTLTDPTALRKELAAIKAKGYALDNEEFELGLKCIAAPLRDYTGEVVASVGIAGAAVRLLEERMDALINLVRLTAQRISAALGFKDVR